MKKKLFFLILLFFTEFSFSQKNINLIIFAETGQNFSLYINNIKCNSKPENNVELINLNSCVYDAKIIIEKDSFILVDKLYTIWDGKPTNNKVFTYFIERKKRNYRIRFLDMKELADIFDTLPKTSNLTINKTCNFSMNNKDFEIVANSIIINNLEDSRLEISKRILDNNCLNTRQIAELCDMFELDETRFDFIKFAFKSCSNALNYKDLASSLKFKKSRKEFDEWINGK